MEMVSRNTTIHTNFVGNWPNFNLILQGKSIGINLGVLYII